MKFTVEKAKAETIAMHDASFNHTEQTTYPINPAVVVEAGDRIVTACTFTNETDTTIRFGQHASDELCFNFAPYEPKGGLKLRRRWLPGLRRTVISSPKLRGE